MSRPGVVQRFVNLHLPDVVSSIDKLGSLAIKMVNVSFETKAPDEFNAIKKEILQTLQVAKSKMTMIKDLIDQGEALWTLVATVIRQFVGLAQKSATMFDELTEEQQDETVTVITNTVNEIKVTFDELNTAFSQSAFARNDFFLPLICDPFSSFFLSIGLTIKDGARVADELLEAEPQTATTAGTPATAAPTASSTASPTASSTSTSGPNSAENSPRGDMKPPGASPRGSMRQSGLLSRVQSVNSSYIANIGKDNFMTRDPLEWAPADVIDFMKGWIGLDDNQLQGLVQNQISGAMLLNLAPGQLAALLPDPEALEQVADVLSDLKDDAPQPTSNISKAELKFMNADDVYGCVSQAADQVAQHIILFTTGFKKMEESLFEEIVVEVPVPEDDTSGATTMLQTQHRKIVEDEEARLARVADGRAIAEDASEKLTQSIFDMVILIQSYGSKVPDDKFLIQELLSRVNMFQITSLQFKSNIQALINATSDTSLRLQVQAAARSFAKTVTDMLDELQRVHLYQMEAAAKAITLEAQARALQERSKEFDEEANHHFKQYVPPGYPNNQPQGRVRLGSQRDDGDSSTDVRVRNRSSAQATDFKPQNIWMEREYHPRFIIFEGDGPDKNKDELSIRAGSLNQLVMRLTNSRKVDTHFMKTFLMTYHSFTTAEELFLKLLERYYVPRGLDMEENSRKSIQLRVINTIKKWLLERFRDFGPALLKQVTNFCLMLQSDGHTSLALQIATALEKMNGDVQKRNRVLLSAANGLYMRVKHIGKKNVSPVQFVERAKAHRIAEHLTLIDQTHYRSIQPAELLGKAWSKSDGKLRSPHITSMVERFNAVSYWTASCILWCDKVKDRTKMLKKFISILTELEKIKNFNAAMAVLAGLANSAVHRLKYSWEDVSDDYKAEHSRVKAKLSSELSYKVYREVLHSSPPPLIPYLGVYLTDITFIEDGNPDQNEGLINFRKREMVFKVIDEIMTYQQDRYEFSIDHPILSALQELPFNHDEDLYKMSLQREPRGAPRIAIV
jgi:hypothetical protein